MKIGLYGAGSWGAALGITLVHKGHKVYLWSNDRDEADKIQQTRRLLHKLSEILIPEEIIVTDDDGLFMKEADILVIAVPSKFIDGFAQKQAKHLTGKPKIVVTATKGLEAGTLATMTDVMERHWQDECIRGVVALSGPSHAEEVARKMPTAIVSAHEDESLAKEVQEAFQTSYFRVYTNGDRKGVEIGAALKNIIAIAVGISDGLGFGDNARAGLISRGLYELSRAGLAMGAQPETFTGLSGLGDLVVTCTSQHSRNRKFGELLAKGYKQDEAVEEIGMVVEGITAVNAVPDIKKRYDVNLPISEEVYAIVHNNSDPKKAVKRLMLRELKPERLSAK